MGIEAWAALAGILATAVGTIVGMSVSWAKQQAHIDAVRSECLNDTELVRQDLSNHKLNHEKLEARVMEHENKIDTKLESIGNKMDELKDLIIETLKK